MDMNKIIPPPPMVKTMEPLEFSDPTQPGEIKIDKAGRLLKENLRYQGPFGSIVDQYNNWIANVLAEQFASQTLKMPEGYVKFENISLIRPTIQTSTKKQIPLYPDMCRNSGYNYAADIYADAVHVKEGTEERSDKPQFMGKLPVMLGSNLDWLTTKSEQERTELGEGIGENSGYFIIKGTEKIVLIQEKLRANRFFVFNSTSKGDMVVKITNNTLMGSTQITMAQGKKSGALKMHLGFLKRNKGPSNKLGNTVSIFQIYRMLGVSKPEEILKYISLFSKPEHMKKIFVALQPSFVKLSKIGDDIEYVSKKIGLGNVDYSIRKTDIIRDLKNQLFPQISADNITQKLYMLSMMTVRLVECLIGVRDLDDRDNWGNKQLVSAGKSLELLFSSIWREAINKAQKEIDTKKLTGLKAAQRAMEPSFVTDNFIESFTANNWGVQSSFMAKENITDILKRDSVLSVYSHLTKINTPTSRKAKSPKIRMVQMSQLGYIDPGETPEGEQCGLVKNASMTCYISLDRPESVVIERVQDYISGAPNESQMNPFILNGVFQGWVNGPEVRDYMIGLRRKLILAKDTTIVLERDGTFNIYTDSSRPTRPLLIVDPDGVLVVEKKDLWKADFNTLLSEGAVEYIDAWEQENIMLAQSIKDVEFRKSEIEMALIEVKKAEENLSGKTTLTRVGSTQSIEDYQTPSRKETKNLELMLTQAQAVLKELTDKPGFTHSEMDPTAIMSLAISIIPLAETNPGPRLTYQAGMGKQSLGIYHSGHASRFDTTSKLLAYPSRPMFETQMNEVLGLNELPAGETVIVAFTTYSGFAQEDAIVMNKASIDRGLFRSVIYKTYKTVAKKNERFTRPEIEKSKEKKYDSLNENGLPRLGSFVKEGDAIIGKVRRNPETKQMENASIFVEVRQEGIIDRVLVTTNQEGHRVVKVKIRHVRKPILGDKFASRYAQKGTIGMILPPEDMPFTRDGTIPDILINSHCFPKDTPVSTHRGYSKRISDFTTEGGEKLWTWNGNSYDVSSSMGMESKGVKKLVEVWFEDGRVIKCTPDHRFLTSDQNWIEAQHLDTQEKNGKGNQIVCGLEMPLDKPEEDIGSTWTLESASYKFDMTTPLNREKVLAFARIIGFTLTDGCVSEREDVYYGYCSTLNMGHNIDAQAVQDDIFLITGRKPKYYESKGTVNIRLPASLSGAIGLLPGVQSGKRSGQEITLPDFVNDPNCPKSVIREFIGGLFGGDGVSPYMLERGETRKNDAPLLIQCGFVQTTQEGFTNSLKAKMENISALLEKLGVETSRIDGPQPIYYNGNGYKPKDDIPRYSFTIQLKTNSQFANKVGFRYCIQKACRLSAAVAYWRYQEEIVRQHSIVVEKTKELYDSGTIRQHTNKKSIKLSLEKARTELKEKEPVINKHYSLSNINDIHNRRNQSNGTAKTLSRFLYKHMMDVKVFFEKIGCLHWFQRKDKAKMDYIVERDSMVVPGFNLEVLGLRDGGEEEVFDIGVHEHHNFLAHGAVVHNCIPSRMTIGKMIEIVTSKVSAFTGERANATAFRKFDTQEFMRNLTQYGYSSSGKERMYSGFTGKPLEARIFIGPCYYQALRHQVQDKIQMRARGGITQLTHQPVSGLKRGGGQRVGEMERDAIISHGASAFLRERLCLVSDAYETVYCSTCGQIAITDDTTYVCRTCEEEAVFGRATIPYSFKLLTQLLQGANFQISFQMKQALKNE